MSFEEKDNLLSFSGNYKTTDKSTKLSFKGSIDKDMFNKGPPKGISSDRVDRLFNHCGLQIKKELCGDKNFKIIQQHLTKYLIKSNKYLFKNHSINSHRPSRNRESGSVELMKKSIKQRKTLMKLAKNYGPNL